MFPNFVKVSTIVNTFVRRNWEVGREWKRPAWKWKWDFLSPSKWKKSKCNKWFPFPSIYACTLNSTFGSIPLFSLVTFPLYSHIYIIYISIIYSTWSRSLPWTVYNVERNGKINCLQGFQNPFPTIKNNCILYISNYSSSSQYSTFIYNRKSGVE